MAELGYAEAMSIVDRVLVMCHDAIDLCKDSKDAAVFCAGFQYTIDNRSNELISHTTILRREERAPPDEERRPLKMDDHLELGRNLHKALEEARILVVNKLKLKATSEDRKVLERLSWATLKPVAKGVVDKLKSASDTVDGKIGPELEKLRNRKKAEFVAPGPEAPPPFRPVFTTRL